MKQVILIGFEYNSLPGTIIDLYLAIKWCQTFKCNINVITDIREFDLIFLDQSIKKRIVSNDIFNIFDITTVNIIKDKDEFIDKLSSLCNLNDDNIIYFTGHADSGKMILPNNNKISFVDFKNIISNNCPYNSDIFIIMDCCSAEGLFLQYKLQNNSFILKEDRSYVSQKVLLITSSNYDQKSIATKYGSVFSQVLFEQLYKISFNPKNISILELRNNISKQIKNKYPKYNQSVSIYSSEIIETDLWLWIS
ncbi:MAG: hypothetical protein QM487_15260 [Candidatus Marithrix sp.]